MLIHSESLADTDEFAGYLAEKILKGGARKHAVVVSLVGPLGAGKTHFVKAFIRALGVKENITSPTFNIMKIYEIKTPRIKNQESRIGFKNAYHIDAYRIKSKDLLKLGWREIVKDPTNIVLIEWADIVSDILSTGVLKVEIEHTQKESGRKITLSLNNS